jgi:5-methylcytosine-specific restriction endonuclease McrA
MKPCKRGHFSLRTAKRECVECKRANSAEHYRANSDAYKIRARRQTELRPKGTRNTYQALYNEENKLQRGAYAQAYRRDEKNRERINAHNRNRKARKKNAEGVHAEADLIAIRTAQGGVCFYCGGSLEHPHADHFLPLSKGGSNARWNIVVACAKCNIRKGNKPPLLFMNFAAKSPHFWGEKELAP